MSDTIQNTLYYPPDRDLSSGQCYPPIERRGSRLHLSFSAVRKPSGGIKQQLEFYNNHQIGHLILHLPENFPLLGSFPFTNRC